MSQHELADEPSPFLPEYWGEILLASRHDHSASYNLGKATFDRATELALKFEAINDGPEGSTPIKIYEPGEEFDLSILPPETVVRFTREYISWAGANNAQLAREKLSKLQVTRPGLVATYRDSDPTRSYDADADTYWEFNHELQSGAGIVLKGRVKTLYGVIKPGWLIEEHSYEYPTGTVYPSTSTIRGTTRNSDYELIDLNFPANTPSPIGVSTESTNLDGDIDPYSRRVERINSVEILYMPPQPLVPKSFLSRRRSA